MQHIACLIAVGTIAVAGSAAAQDPAPKPQDGQVKSERFTVRFAPERNFYADLRIGGVFLEDAESTTNASSFFPDIGEADFETGSSINGALGYRLTDNFRADIEINFNSNEFDQFSLDDAGELFFVPGFFGPVAFVDEPELNAFTYTANLYYDFAIGKRLRPYIGVGFGGAILEVNDALLIEDSDTVWLAQGRAGFTFPLSGRIAATLGYRYQIAGDPEFIDAFATAFESEYTSHSIEGGVRFAF